MIWVEQYQVKKSNGELKTLERIYAHRGDSGVLEYSAKADDDTPYQFQPGDVLEFTVFEKNGYNKTPVIDKQIEIAQATTTVNIELTESDTTIGEAQNKSIEYWYEISLNADKTINGYDEDDNPLEFILLPAKAGDN